MWTGTSPRRMRMLCGVVLLTGIAASCIGVFDAYTPSRKLPGGYRLTMFEGEYDIEVPNGISGARVEDGRLQGEVRKLGWNGRYIVVMTPGPRGGSPVWTIVDLRAKTISEPMSGEELATKRNEQPELAAVTVYDVAEAWRRPD